MIDVSRWPGSATVSGRIMRAPLQLIPRGTVVPILQGPLRGKRWIVDSGIHRLWLGSYEMSKMALAARWVNSGDTVFDIGAHVGIYTLLFSGRVGNPGHVVSFEPSPRNVAFLRRHVQLNRLGNVTVIEAALSSSARTARFSLTDSLSTGHLASCGTLDVQTLTIDAVVESQHRVPALMKIDVEGAEMEVLLGAEGALTDVRPVILIATHSEALKRACTEYLIRKAYRVRSLHSSGADSLELIAEPGR
jgi:FkbM family methyltransferase